MQILGIESSTKILSVSLSEDGIEISSLHLKSSDGFITNIITVIDTVLKKGRSKIEKVDIFAANKGPGDFTGTRIGLSVVKTFAFIESKPVYGISSPDAYAASILENNYSAMKKAILHSGSVLAVPVLDVKRNELFFSIYEAGFSDYPESVARCRVKETEIYIKKITGDYLVEYDSFKGLLEKVLLSGSLILSNSAKTSIYCGGTAFDTYKHLGPDLKKLGYNFTINKKTIFPHARYINVCASFNASREIEKAKAGAGPAILCGDSNVAPVYVREFVPFK
jgi:tRNA threonylcarbamoyl adenosine modification protein YeaZ